MPHSFDAEIFAAGVHHGVRYTEADLDDMVANFGALRTVIKPPVKFGHWNKRHLIDGKPALGWIDGLRRMGTKLLAHFSDVPDVLYQAIQQKLYRRVSSEVLHDFSHDGKTYKRVLYAVGLMGADQPEVKNLEDLTAYMAQSAADEAGLFENVALYSFATDEDGKITSTEEENMPDDKIKELEDQLAAEKAAREKAEAELKALKDADAETRKKGAAEEVRTFCEDQVKAGKMSPAARDVLCADLNLHTYSDDAGFSIGFATLKQFCAQQAVLPLGEAAKAKADAEGGKAYADVNAELDAKAKKHAAEHKTNYIEAVGAVLNADEDLAARYSALAGTDKEAD